MTDKLKQNILELIKKISFLLTSTVFIWCGWNIFAWHFDLPQFNYLEVLVMRMALSHIIIIFSKNIKSPIDKS